MKLKGKNIAVVSNEPWGETWYSKHNYAYELSRNNKVYFINPASRWKPANLLARKVEVKEITPNLFTVNYDNILPALNPSLFRLNNQLVSRLLRSFFRQQHVTDMLFWTFDPYRLYHPRALGASVSVFHSVDKYDFKPLGERMLCRNADHIFIISRSYFDTYKPLNRSVHLVPHGISSDEFSAEPADFAIKDYGLYVGNIDSRLDYGLIEKALVAFPSVPFVFIGRLSIPQDNATAIKLFKDQAYPNLHIAGEKHFKQLKNYIAGARFCIAFMNQAHSWNLISHHKIFQYMALGKPVFSCSFSEYESFSHLLYMNNNSELLLKQLDQFLNKGEDATLAGKRIEIARQHSFEAIFESVEKIFAAHP